MTKPAALFLAVTSGLVAVYLLLAALFLKEGATTPADDALINGLWVAFGAAAIVLLCATFEVVSERLNQEHHRADS